MLLSSQILFDSLKYYRHFINEFCLLSAGMRSLICYWKLRTANTLLIWIVLLMSVAEAIVYNFRLHMTKCLTKSKLRKHNLFLRFFFFQISFVCVVKRIVDTSGFWLTSHPIITTLNLFCRAFHSDIRYHVIKLEFVWAMVVPNCAQPLQVWGIFNFFQNWWLKERFTVNPVKGVGERPDNIKG